LVGGGLNSINKYRVNINESMSLSCYLEFKGQVQMNQKNINGECGNVSYVYNVDEREDGLKNNRLKILKLCISIVLNIKNKV